MTSSEVIAILLGVLGPGSALLTWQAATRANRFQAQTAAVSVSAEAYTRAKDIYVSALEAAQEDQAATRRDLAEVRAELRGVQTQLKDARLEISRLREQLNGR